MAIFKPDQHNIKSGDHTQIGDPDDDHVLACALAAEADLVVTRDTRLLNLKHFHRIPIVLAAEAIRHIATA